MTRPCALFAREREAWKKGITPVAGLDEAGRGPLAGPVVAAAVIFPCELEIPNLRDSKQLTPRMREKVFAAIQASGALVGVGVADVEEIDMLNILGATKLAWVRAVGSLELPPALLLVDGNVKAPLAVPQITLVLGDRICASIAAASVVAKVTRDRLMVELDMREPRYGFARHKGYATPAHLAALRKHGPSPEHRRAFLPTDLRKEQPADDN